MDSSQRCKFGPPPAIDFAGRTSRRNALRFAGAAAATTILSPLLSGPAAAQAAIKRIRLAHPAPTAHGWHQERRQDAGADLPECANGQ